jgi:carbon-monoxide dehydrogenase medium subunit
MYDFHYHRPKSLADAVGLLKGKDEARPMSGGMTLIPTLKQRLAKPSDVVDLGGIKELAGIKVEGNNVVVGAMTRHAEVATSADVMGANPAQA